MKNLVAIIILFLSVSLAHAQSENDKNKVYVNPKVGVHFASLSTETAEQGSRVGMNVGIDMLIKSSKKSWFFWQPGLHYYRTGAQLVHQGTTQQEMDNQVHFNTLKAPISGGMYLTGSDGLLRIWVNAGITPTLLLGVQENEYGLSREAFRGATLGINGGIGIEVLIVTLELNYEHGITPMLSGNEGTNRMFSISAGLRF
ncbi:outer membrane beta-barrel protein [Tunicatimonas pelagia]|uniref:outer membrane beta-barrel protein n=1 Tax=Tunicatimonas pelagia TaxID=931531 RepID=UPI0026655E40|nr:outer membrane beta-barrel protein [Tunicatimonas pelagia]WKN44425.1 outer membrane beta-barrel protein [Tunicatimonas pelagia]